MALVKILIHRIYFICNTWICFHENLTELKEILERNMFPPNLIDKEIKNYLDNKFLSEDSNKTKTNLHYYKLPYIGKLSKETQRKIKDLCQKYCKEINIKLSFSLFKIGSLFSVKRKIPSNLRSFVVYYFCCPSCNASYVGETTRHLVIRIKEHLLTDKGSVILNHLKQNQNCEKVCNETCFEIID